MKKKIIIAFIAALAFWFFGFVIGKKAMTKEIKTECVKGELIKGSISSFEPIKEETPKFPVLPTISEIIYRDTGSVIVQKVDTTAIIAEYEKKRYYSELLFDSNTGKLEIDLTTQYNKLTGIDYRFTPIHTVRTIEKKRVWIPFVSASYSTLNYFSAGGGMFYHDIGINVRYITDFNRKGIDIGLIYKF
jgi:hypothetical protein